MISAVSAADVGIAIDAKDLCPLACKGHRGRLAIAPARPDRAGADHDRCLAFQTSHAAPPFVCRIGCTGSLRSTVQSEDNGTRQSRLLGVNIRAKD